METWKHRQKMGLKCNSFVNTYDIIFGRYVVWGLWTSNKISAEKLFFWQVFSLQHQCRLFKDARLICSTVVYTIIVYLFPRHFVLHQTLCPVYLGSSCNPLSPFVRLCKTLEWIVWSLPVKQTRKECSRDFFRPSTNGVTSLGVLVHPCDEGFYSICLTDLLVSVSSKGNLSAILHKLILHSWIKVVSLFVARFLVA